MLFCLVKGIEHQWSVNKGYSLQSFTTHGKIKEIRP